METIKTPVIRVKFKTTANRLKFWNGPIGLSDKELEVLGVLIDSKGDLCGTLNRKEAGVSLSMSKEVINNYISKIKKKGAITFNKNICTLHFLLADNGPRMEILILRNAAPAL